MWKPFPFIFTTTLTIEGVIRERHQVARTVVKAADGRVPVTVGAQTTSARELVELTKLAERAGAKYIQVSPPFYFKHTEDEFFEYVSAAA